VALRGRMNGQLDFDVIVAGAGAAGAAAAYHLAQAGLRVGVIDKAPLPRYKACGGAIPRPALKPFPFSFGPVILAAPTAVRFTFPGLPEVEVPLPDRPVVLVRRSQFDSFLLDRSQAEVLAGVAVRGVIEDADRVQVEAGERTFTARYLVGADGAVSAVARALGLRRRRQPGGAVEAEVPLGGDPGLREGYGNRALFALGVIPWGYAWVFPRGDHLSVGVCRLRPGRVDLRRALGQEASRLGISLDGVPIHGHPLPGYRAASWPWRQGQAQEKLATRRCLLVGDAAGLVDPLLGEGIRYALTSGRLAAEAILNGDLSGYERSVWREIGHSLATASLAASLFYRLPRLSYRLGVRNPATVRQFVDLLTEKVSYVGIGRRLIVTTIRWMLGRGD